MHRLPLALWYVRPLPLSSLASGGIGDVDMAVQMGDCRRLSAPPSARRVTADTRVGRPDNFGVTLRNFGHRELGRGVGLPQSKA